MRPFFLEVCSHLKQNNPNLLTFSTKFKLIRVAHKVNKTLFLIGFKNKNSAILESCPTLVFKESWAYNMRIRRCPKCNLGPSINNVVSFSDFSYPSLLFVTTFHFFCVVNFFTIFDSFPPQNMITSFRTGPFCIIPLHSHSEEFTILISQPGHIRLEKLSISRTTEAFQQSLQL